MSEDSEHCHGNGVWNGQYPCDCESYYAGGACQYHIWQLIGIAFPISQWVWVGLYSVQSLYVAFVLVKNWSLMRPLFRGALILIILAALSQIVYRAMNAEAAHGGYEGCFGSWLCPVGDFFFALFYANLITCLLLFIQSWLTITAMIRSHSWLARKGTKDFTNNSNGTFFLQVYYLFAGAIILISMLVAGLPVLRVIRFSKDVNSFRFTSLLVVCVVNAKLLSSTGILHLISSIIIVLSRANNRPTLYFWGIHILNSLYMLSFGWIMVMTMRPRPEDQHSGSLPGSPVLSRNEVGVDSAELFSSLDRSGRSVSEQRVESLDDPIKSHSGSDSSDLPSTSE